MKKRISRELLAVVRYLSVCALAVFRLMRVCVSRVPAGLCITLCLCSLMMSGCGGSVTNYVAGSSADSAADAGSVSSGGVASEVGSTSSSGMASDAESLSSADDPVLHAGTASESTSGSDAEAGAGTVSDAGSDMSGSGTIYVYVCGEVNNPGVYQLSAGSRVYQALEAAGGMTESADLKVINQAELLTDGEQITVYSVAETSSPGFSASAGNHAGSSGNSSGSASSAGSGTGKVNINTATKEELMTLSGIGESRAEDIIRYREEHGGFSSIDEIQNVSGIGEKSFQKIEDQIEV